MRRTCTEILARLGVELDVDQRTSALSAAQTQMIGLARCLLLGARLIIMDEPTASLGAHEVEQVYRTVERLRADGISVVYVSHRLDEIAALCDRATVLRDGRLVGRLEHDDLQDRHRLVTLILGVEPSQLVRAVHHERGDVALTARGLWWKNRVQDVDLTLYRGEVTGIAGFVGAGRSELAHLLFGAMRPGRRPDRDRRQGVQGLLPGPGDPPRGRAAARGPPPPGVDRRVDGAREPHAGRAPVLRRGGVHPAGAGNATATTSTATGSASRP